MQFRVGNVFTTVNEALKATGLAPERLDLEITESVLLDRTDQVIAHLHALRALGVRISMDDFGTGYSSLSYLRAFPFDKIKIDRSFVRDLPGNRHTLAIVRAILGLAVRPRHEGRRRGYRDAGGSRLPRRRRLQGGPGLLLLAKPGRRTRS